MQKLLLVAITLGVTFHAFAAWYDNPIKRATVAIESADGQSDAHYINKSADDSKLMVNLNSSADVCPTVLFDISVLRTASGSVSGLAKTVVTKPSDGYGTTWKGGAISSDLNIMISGNGLDSNSCIMRTDVSTWSKGKGLYPLTITGHKADGLDFGTGSTYLYSNADGGNMILRWTFPSAPYSTDANALTFSAQKESGVTRVRNISVHRVNGRELVYYGEGSGSTGKVCAMDVTDADSANWTVSDLTASIKLEGFTDITNAKLSNEDSATPILYVLADNGKLAVCELASDGKSITSIIRTFEPSETEDWCYNVNGNRRTFEVTKDGSCAFFIRKETSGMTTVSVIASAANRVSVTDESGTTEYPTIQQALAACSGGETLTLLTDISLTASLTINAAVTIDLGGHVLRQTEGDFLKTGDGVSGFAVRNGSLYAKYSCIVPRPGAAVTVSNVTVTGMCVIWGTGGNVTLNDCVVKTDYLASSSSSGGCTLTVDGNSVLVPTKNVYDSTGRGTTLDFRSARCSFNPRGFYSSGVSTFVYDPVTISGVVCKYRVLSTAAAAAFPTAYVISADGVTTNGYSTIVEAVASSLSGSTISMLKDCTVAQQLKFPHSVSLELNGLNLQCTSGDFLQPRENVTLNINGDGGLIKLTVPGAIFCVNMSNTRIDVSKCTVSGYCVVFGLAPGVVNFVEAVNLRDCDYLASGNGSALLNAYDGTYQFKAWRDTYHNPGTTIRFYGGYLHKNNNPITTTLSVLGEGCRVFYDSQIADFPHLVVPQDVWSGWSVEASNSSVYYKSLDTALNLAGNGAIVKLEKDIARQVLMPVMSTRRSLSFDFQGHQISYAGKWVNVFVLKSSDDLTFKNGAVRVGGEDACCFTIAANSTLTAKSDFEIVGATGVRTCAFYLNAPNSQVVLDGARVATSYLVSWGASGTGSSMTVQGDGTNIVSGLLFPGTSVPAAGSLSICGGWWSIDPSSYVPTNHLKLNYQGKSPCAWRVRPWTDICAKGWKFDLADGKAVATGLCEVPSEPIVVSFVGEIPTRKTALVDLNDVTPSSGEWTVNSFTLDPSCPRTARLKLEGGVLYYHPNNGMAITIR